MQSTLATACRGKLPDRRLWIAQLSEELGGLYTLPQITIDDIFMVANGIEFELLNLLWGSPPLSQLH